MKAMKMKKRLVGAGGGMAAVAALATSLVGVTLGLFSGQATPQGSGTLSAGRLGTPSLSVSAVTPTSATLTWSPAPGPSPAPTGYTLSQSPGTLGGCSASPSGTTCTATTLSPATAYTWTLHALFHDWESTPAGTSTTTAGRPSGCGTEEVTLGAGVTKSFTLVGGGGGAGGASTSDASIAVGGSGAEVTGSLRNTSVTAAVTLTVVVGCKGGIGAAGTFGTGGTGGAGFASGGSGGKGKGGTGHGGAGGGGGGGGASSLTVGSHLLAVAGGGGGGGGTGTSQHHTGLSGTTTETTGAMPGSAQPGGPGTSPTDNKTGGGGGGGGGGGYGTASAPGGASASAGGLGGADYKVTTTTVVTVTGVDVTIGATTGTGANAGQTGSLVVAP
jgi:hypothetical protein